MSRDVIAMADTNHDGLISTDEAHRAMDMIIGGLFFRADQNHDGVVTPDEAKAVRHEILSERPFIRFIVEDVRATNGKSPLSSLANLVDVNNDKKLDLAEAHKASDEAVTALFTAADTNKDGQLDSAELISAAGKLGDAIMKSIVRAADTDHDGVVSQAEFEQAVLGQARFVFQNMDTNHDGKLSRDEIERSERVIGNVLGFPTVPATPGGDQLRTPKK